MSNYTQQCRICHVSIDGAGENMCYPCLQRDRNFFIAELGRLKTQYDLLANGTGRDLLEKFGDKMVTELKEEILSLRKSLQNQFEYHCEKEDTSKKRIKELEFLRDSLVGANLGLKERLTAAEKDLT